MHFIVSYSYKWRTSLSQEKKVNTCRCHNRYVVPMTEQEGAQDLREEPITASWPASLRNRKDLREPWDDFRISEKDMKKRQMINIQTRGKSFVMVIVNCQLERILHHLRDGSPISVGDYLDYVNGSQNAPHCGWQHSLTGILHCVSGDSKMSTGMPSWFFVPDWACKVIYCLKSLPLWLPYLKIWSRINAISFKLLLSGYFIIARTKIPKQPAIQMMQWGHHDFHNS